MAPIIPSAEVRLSYPLYALDFDPEDANRLIVGGGGGAAKSGVGNKVSVLDVSHEEALQIVSELELSRDEDSVNTLSVGARKGNSVLFYAGINSAEEELKKGKNEHFRVFAADLPSKTKSAAKIAELSRSALFSTPDTEAYQRLLRISGQVGAVATGTIGRSKDAQIGIFDLPSATSSSPAPKLRGNLDLAKEAMDMDLLQVSDNEHQLVYCDDHNVYTLVISKSGIEGPHSIYTFPEDEQLSFRSIRFLTPTFVLAVANLPKARGAVIQGFRLPKLSDLGKEEKEGKARLAISAKLPKSVARATGLAVRSLSPRATPSAKQPDTQFVVAVTGQDSSISIYTLEHQTVGDVNLIASLYPVTTLKEVHLGPISGTAFSHFIPPPSSPSTTPSKQPPHLKLASIGSMGNTCVVHTLPLKKLIPSSPSSSSTTEKQQQQQQPQQRYALALAPRTPTATNLLLGIAAVVAFLALLLQGVLEIKGLSRPVVGARALTPVRWHSPGIYYAVSDAGAALPVTPVPGGWGEEWKAWAERGGEEGEGEGAGKVPVFLHRKAAAGGGEKDGEGEGEVSVEGHDEELHGPAKLWEQLHPAQKEAWREKLKSAGHWSEKMGEAVFKGVLFGEIGGVVGAMVA